MQDPPELCQHDQGNNLVPDASDGGELFEQPWQGHALVVLQCSISAIAAVFSEYMLKKTGQSIHVQNIQMYSSSSVVFALITLFNTCSRRRVRRPRRLCRGCTGRVRLRCQVCGLIVQQR